MPFRELPSTRDASLKALARGIALFVIVGTGLLTAFMSQASSPDYRRLFWSILPFALFHLCLVVGDIIRVHRWLALGIGLLAALAFAEMTLRIWL